MTTRTLSIEIPDSARIPEDLGQGALEYLFMNLLRSRGWIDSADVDRLAGERAQEFEEQLAACQPAPAAKTAKGGKWAAVAQRYREKPNLLGQSEKVEALVREFRDEFAF